MSTILDEIVASKRRELADAQYRRPLAELERACAAGPLPTIRDFTAALARPDRMRLIAEVKKASPSAGIIRADFDPVAIARTYQDHGADGVSVLTDEPFFQGRLDFLSRIREQTAVPLLRKDFLLDRYQLLEARLAGADAVLLIAEILPGHQLAQLHRQAAELGLHVLVELHDREQLPRVLDCGARLIGVNNRDLRTFTTRLEHTLELAARVPADRVLVSESGIRTPDDLRRLAAAGVRAVLVGESLMRAADIGAALDALHGRAQMFPPG